MKSKFKVIDLFSGCGGFALGLKSLGSFDFLAAVDIDGKAVISYNYNLNQDNNILCKTIDLTEFKPEMMEKEIGMNDIDVIIGGPPCPGFSTIGRSKIMGLVKNGKWESSDERHQFIEDPRNKLFFEYVDYVDHFKPKMFVFENVKGLGSYKKKVSGSTKDMLDLIKREFTEKGYHVKHELLNSADFGVPQIRERYFIVGLRKDLSNEFDFIFPKKTHKKRIENHPQTRLDSHFKSLKNDKPKLKKYVTSMQAIIDLPVFEGFVEDLVDEVYNYELSIHEAVLKFKKFYKSDPIVKDDQDLNEMIEFLSIVRSDNKILSFEIKESNKITCHYPRKINKLGDREIFPKLYTKRNDRVVYGDLDNEDLKRYKNGFHDMMRRIPWWRPSWTIIAHLKIDGYMFIHPDNITPQHRSITAREAARLQSFPDWFDFSAGGKIARGDQFKHIGNAVPPLVARRLGESVSNWLKQKS